MAGWQAARMGDEVGAHSCALGGLIAGLVIGIAAGVLLGALLIATVATGGAALAVAGAWMVAIGGTVSIGAVGGKLGKNLGASFGAGSPCSKVSAGSPDTWIEDQPAARAEVDTANHGSPRLITQGSSTVFVNGRMLARNTDGVSCGGKLVSHCRNVWVGGPPSGAPSCEVPWWATDENLDRIALAGGVAAITGSVLAFGATATVVMGAIGFLGSKAGHFAGGLIGKEVDRLARYSDGRFEAFGAGLGELSAGIAGAFGRPGRWQMNASVKIGNAIGQNRLTGSALNRQLITRGADPLPAGLAAIPGRDPGELYALKKEGFGWDAEHGLSPGSLEYGQRMHAAVQEVGARVKSGELRTAREAMDAIAEHRKLIAEASNDSEARYFGVRRDVGWMLDARARTPLEGWKYEYAMKRAVPADGTDRPPWVEYIDGEYVDLTAVQNTPDDGWAWIHSPGRSIAPVMRRVEVLYARALDPTTSVAETTEAVGELHYLLAHAMPYARGSASITDGLTKMIFGARGIVVSPWKVGIVPDIEALVSTDLGGFSKGYGAMMEHPPGSPFPAGQEPACGTCTAAAVPLRASELVAGGP